MYKNNYAIALATCGMEPAIIKAAKKGDFEVVLNVSPELLQSLIIIAAMHNQFNLVNRLIAHYKMKEFPSNLLHFSARFGAVETVEFLINEGVNLYHRDLVHNNELAVETAIMAGQLEVIELFTSKGFDFNTLKPSNVPLLDKLARLGHFNIFKQLIENNITIKKGELDSTSFYSAAYRACPRKNDDVETTKGKIEIIKYLLAQGMNINAKNRPECNVLCLAALNGQFEIVKFLVGHTDIDIKYAGYAGTALHFAVRSNSSNKGKIAGFLINSSIELNAVNRLGNTALSTLIQHLPIFTLVESAKIIKLLLLEGASPAIKNNRGQSAYTIFMNFYNKYNKNCHERYDSELQLLKELFIRDHSKPLPPLSKLPWKLAFFRVIKGSEPQYPVPVPLLN